MVEYDFSGIHIPTWEELAAAQSELETIVGNLLAYKELVPGTMWHADELTTERRFREDDNPATRQVRQKLRNQQFYTADGELYTIQEGKVIWAITREPQNLVLKNIDEAYRQLTENGNYFPLNESAELSFKHQDTIKIEVDGLKLVPNNKESDYFVVDPKKIILEKDTPERLAAQRIFGGPNKDDFEQNMEMFTEAKKIPFVSVLKPDYVQNILSYHNDQFLGRASWLNNFNGSSNFFANDCYVDYLLNTLRGVRHTQKK